MKKTVFKRTLYLFTAMALWVGTAVPAAAADVGVNVKGAPVQWSDASPFIDANSRTMVPLRAVGDALGLTVDWDNNAREAVFSNGSKTIYFPIDKKVARTSEGSSVTMDTAAVIVNSRTYAPVRYLAEYFGYQVDWDGATRTVVMSGGDSANGGTSQNNSTTVKSFSNEELCEMARAYYRAQNGYEPPIVEVDHEDGNQVIIHLYEWSGNHTATSGWYSIDRTTGKGKDMLFDTAIDLTNP